MYFGLFCFFFFFKQKTAYEMRISDWSSDVCSSDLIWVEEVITPPIMGNTIGFITSVPTPRSEEHTSELQSLMRISYAVFCLKKKTDAEKNQKRNSINQTTALNHLILHHSYHTI